MGIDWRPQTGQLYGLGVDTAANHASLYLLDPQTGAATAVGPTGQIAFVDAGGNPVDLPTGYGYSFDFNPTVDRIRVVTDTGLNFRVNPNTGVPVDGNPLAVGINPDGPITGLPTGSLGVSATAYTNSYGQLLFGGATTQYVLDTNSNRLYIQNPPNDGTLIGGIPVTVNGNLLDFNEINAFDIPGSVRVTNSGNPAAGKAYATLTVAGVTRLYVIELATGAAAQIGQVSATNVDKLNGLAIGDAETGPCFWTVAAITGTSGDDTLIGTASNDVIIGGGGADHINGLGGNDTICGDAGNDVLSGGPGNDGLEGGAGVDTASYTTAGAPVTASLTSHKASGAAGSDTFTAVENLSGSPFSDTLVGNAGANTIRGGNGTDRLSGDAGNDTLTGDAGNDELSGGPGNDQLSGSAGNDALIGRGGGDRYQGGIGIDTVSFAASGSALRADLTTRTATGEGGDQLTAVENLIGSRFNDLLTGNTRANTLNGGNGNDRLSGRAGKDLLVGKAGNDTLNGGINTDTCSGGVGTDTATRCETTAAIP